MGGFGGAVLELLTAEGVVVPTRTLGIADQLIEHGETTSTVGIAPADIQRAVVELLAGTRALDGAG